MLRGDEVIVCDKCKRELNQKEKRASWHIVLQTDNSETFNEIDICPHCIGKLADFLTSKE